VNKVRNPNCYRGMAYPHEVA